MELSNYKSRVVKIGGISVGGDNPIRIQSMTSTNTMDTKATVEQSIRMIEAGCELVRITAPGVREALHLQVIKDELKLRGFNVPLIADIHYQPKAADAAAKIVEKVRINPGNYTDRKRGALSFSEEEYQSEILKIRERISPLINICKEFGTTLRIGSNHGSLSERILYRFGDTPQGMVESAMEFVRICHEMDFHNIVLSMKASNVRVMVKANRLLVEEMKKAGFDYPIHLGVTEAGDAEDGRLKSAAGIGPLLVDGIGDTIRVSLTEDPEFEIPVAQEIVESSKFEVPSSKYNKNPERSRRVLADIQETKKRETTKFGLIGGGQVPVVILSSNKSNIDNSEIKEDFLPDYYFQDGDNYITSFRNSTEIKKQNFTDFFSFDELKKEAKNPDQNKLLVFNLSKIKHPGEVKDWFTHLSDMQIKLPVIIKQNYKKINENELLIKASIDFSYFLIDELAEGIWIEANNIPIKRLAEISFGILQATRSRITKTEYIACPSCGRTLFRIQDTLQKIKERTSHLKGLKIGVMGCCVNGPGEMADADYGYVGAGKGKISLYKGKQLIKAGIKEDLAVDALVNLIKENNDWK
ncbi:(E)-4-hydroxy-3-methylbut-2-enyl-diphosphate synthase [Desulfosarcina sp.]|nr:(E)-4-hydroxy-3-methylbut-2-enyl-diphosphate synthase [Desulfosarcina sp.]